MVNQTSETSPTAWAPYITGGCSHRGRLATHHTTCKVVPVEYIMFCGLYLLTNHGYYGCRVMLTSVRLESLHIFIVVDIVGNLDSTMGVGAYQVKLVAGVEGFGDVYLQ